MSKLNLSQYRNAMFANRGTDISDALEYALRLTAGNPEGLTAVYVVLNTVINAVEAEARVAASVATHWCELLSTDTPPAAEAEAQPLPIGIMVSAAVRDWLTDNAGDMVADWCLENAGEMISNYCVDNVGGDVDSWMENNANDMIADMVTDKVEGMSFTVTAHR